LNYTGIVIDDGGYYCDCPKTSVYFGSEYCGQKPELAFLTPVIYDLRAGTDGSVPAGTQVGTFSRPVVKDPETFGGVWEQFGIIDNVTGEISGPTIEVVYEVIESTASGANPAGRARRTASALFIADENGTVTLAQSVDSAEIQELALAIVVKPIDQRFDTAEHAYDTSVRLIPPPPEIPKFKLNPRQGEGDANQATSTANSGESGATESEESLSVSLIALIVVMLLLVLLLLGLLVGRMMKKGEDKEMPEAIDMGNAFSNPAGAILAPFVAGALPVSDLADKLWTNFRRATAFDNLYFGNKLMQLGDDALEDIYAILEMVSPGCQNFGSLREIGKRFREQEVGRSPLSDAEVINDVGNFVDAAIADVLVERAIDLCALIAASGNTYADEDIEETFYSMIEQYIPEENHYLCPSEGGSIRRLRPDAANRTVDVDPLYYEINSPNAQTANYALGVERDDSDVYNMASGADESEYAEANGADAEAEYSVAAGLVSQRADPIYGHASPDQSADPLYGMASGQEQGEATYDVGTGPSALEALYDTGNNYGAVGHISGEALYATGAEATYDVGGVSAGGTYGMHAPGQPDEPLYETANRAGSRRPSRQLSIGDVYGIGEGHIVRGGDDATYGLASSGPSPEATYGLADETVDRIYDNNGVSGARSEEEYSNSATLQPAPYAVGAAAESDYERVKANTVQYSVPQKAGESPVDHVSSMLQSRSASYSSANARHTTLKDRSESYAQAINGDGSDTVPSQDARRRSTMMSPAEVMRPVPRGSTSSSLQSSAGDATDKALTVTSADFAGLEEDFAEFARQEREMAALAGETIPEADELEADNDEPEFIAPKSEAEAAAGTGPTWLPDSRPPADPNEYLQVADKKTGKIFEDNGFVLAADGAVRLRSVRASDNSMARSVVEAVSEAEAVGEAGVDGDTPA
jgi:hypothetical protein